MITEAQLIESCLGLSKWTQGQRDAVLNFINSLEGMSFDQAKKVCDFIEGRKAIYMAKSPVVISFDSKEFFGE